MKIRCREAFFLAPELDGIEIWCRKEPVLALKCATGDFWCRETFFLAPEWDGIEIWCRKVPILALKCATGDFRCREAFFLAPELECGIKGSGR